MFRSPQALARVYPALVGHALEHFHCKDVLKFLGLGGNGRFQYAASGNLKHRCEGGRIKHWFEENSIKMYDKQGTVLRVETAINAARDLREYRGSERNPSKKYWRPLRKGVSALSRRADLSQAANERYLNALSAVNTPIRLAEMCAPYGKPRRWSGKRVRALNLLGADDAALLEAVGKAEFNINGRTNSDLR